MVLVEIAVVGLVAYRLWRLVARDSLTAPLRERPYRWHWFRELWDCPWCLGFWICLGLAYLGSVLGYVTTDWLVVGVAASVVTGWLGDTL